MYSDSSLFSDGAQAIIEVTFGTRLSMDPDGDLWNLIIAALKDRPQGAVIIIKLRGYCEESEAKNDMERWQIAGNHALDTKSIVANTNDGQPELL